MERAQVTVQKGTGAGPSPWLFQLCLGPLLHITGFTFTKKMAAQQGGENMDGMGYVGHCLGYWYPNSPLPHAPFVTLQGTGVAFQLVLDWIICLVNWVKCRTGEGTAVPPKWWAEKPHFTSVGFTGPRQWHINNVFI